MVDQTATNDVEPTTEDDALTLPGVDVTVIAALQADTPPEEIHYRPAFARNGQPVQNPDGTMMNLAYVTARFVQDRLDDVVGAVNWQSVFVDLPDGSVRAGIGVLVNRGENSDWVWKYDVGTRTMVEPVKGAHSDAFKRAGVQWGIARDLYDERDEEATPAPQTAAVAPVPQVGLPPQPIQQQVTGPVVPPPQPIAGAAWLCPLHNDTKIVPGGVSQRTGRAYNAFYACPVPGCDQKGPSVRAQMPVVTA